jgi:hypothetical protein
MIWRGAYGGGLRFGGSVDYALRFQDLEKQPALTLELGQCLE